MLEKLVSFTKTKYIPEVYQQCISCFAPNNLSQSELNILNSLRQKASVPYNASDEKHSTKLKALYELVWNVSPSSLESEKWKEIGFQSSHPESDFRAGGYLSLKQLVFICKNYPVEFGEMSANDYPFAISAINVTYQLIYLFQLNIETNRGLPGVQRGSLNVLRNFLKFCQDVDHGLYEIYVAAVFKMNQAWIEMPHSNIMKFSECISRAIEFVRDLFKYPIVDIEDFKARAFN